MKRNRIFLDFTSLLDITMIILFWFLINFKNTADAIKSEAAEQSAQAQSYAAELEEQQKEFELEKEAWLMEAADEMDKIRSADENAAKNAQALMDFQKNIVLTIKLDIESKNNRTVTIRNGNTQIGDTISFSGTAELTDSIIKAFEDAGFKKDDVIIGIFMYDGNSAGSASIKYSRDSIEDSIKEVCREYKQFYCSSINISR